MATGDLITLAQLQTALPKLSAADLAFAPTVISGASALVAARYPRCQPPTQHDEEYEAGTNRTIRLRNKPILSVDGIYADNNQVITITRTDKTSIDACVTLTTTPDATTPVGCELKAWRRGVVQSDESLDFATYPYFGALADQVNTLAGWGAVVAPGWEDLDTARLRPVQGGYGAMGPGAPLRAYTRRLYDFACTRETGELVIFEWRQEGYRHPDRMWGTDPRNSAMRVIYTAGVATTPDVVMAMTIYVKALLEAQKRPGIFSSESSEDYSYRIACGEYAIPQQARVLLSRYKDRTFS